MEKETNNAAVKVLSDVSKAVGDKEPKVSFEVPSSEAINSAYLSELDEYSKAPVGACSKDTALKLLKSFAKKSFCEFWEAPICEYLPAVSEGSMRLCETVYPHDTANRYAKKLISELSPKELAKDFVYGVAHNAPEYRTALACYYYIKNLPDHSFKKKWVGMAPNEKGELEDRYNETGCEVCGYNHAVSNEPKMRFYYVNGKMESFFLTGAMPRSSLNTAIFYLEQYKELPRPKHSTEDLECFMRIIDVIEKAPLNTTSGKLRGVLKQSGLLKMTAHQLEVFIDMLGYLDILHSDDSHGMVFSHTLSCDMLQPLSDRSYAAHPVYRWTGKCGVDRKSIAFLFDGIYD